MESLIDKSCKKILEHNILPIECYSHLINQKIYKLEVPISRKYFNQINSPHFFESKTVLIDFDLNKCIFEMLKFFGTDYGKLNEYNNETKDWIYFLDINNLLNFDIYIEELSIGKLNPFEKIIFQLSRKNELQRKIINLDDQSLKIDKLFSYKFEPLEHFDVNKASIFMIKNFKNLTKDEYYELFKKTGMWNHVND